MGWKLLVKWSDGLESWVPLKDMKESHPVEVADFAKARGIADEPAFSWWVPYMLRKRDVIISKVKSRIRKTTHKYGIEMATSVGHAYEIDKGNGNTLWRDAIKKEMTNVGIAFEVLEEGEHAPVAWRKVSGHLYPGKAYASLSHMPPLMGWMSAQLTYGTRTCKHRRRRRTM